MAKRFVYQKGMHGYSDFVYVDLLPHVKRARQFNVNVIVALLVLIILTYVLVFVPYSDKLYQYEDLKAQNNDLTHELTLTNEEYIGYEINEDLINFEGNIDHEKDYDLHDKLAEQGHWSPFEHCASPLHDPKESSGNFLGWHQYRKSFQQ